MQPKDILRYTGFTAPMLLSCAICFQVGYFKYLGRSIFSMLSISELIVSSIHVIPEVVFGLMIGSCGAMLTRRIHKCICTDLDSTTDKNLHIIDIISVTAIFVLSVILLSISTRNILWAVTLTLTMALWLFGFTKTRPLKFLNNETMEAALSLTPIALLYIVYFGHFVAHIEVTKLLNSPSKTQVTLKNGQSIRMSSLRTFRENSVYITDKGTLILRNTDIQSVMFIRTGKLPCDNWVCLNKAWER